MDPRVTLRLPEDDWEREVTLLREADVQISQGYGIQSARSHATLDAAAIGVFDRGWIHGSRYACPRMTGKEKSRCFVNSRFGFHGSGPRMTALSETEPETDGLLKIREAAFLWQPL
ncbi:hypothetical protein OO006_04680 [Prosthecochloris sp. SCSIO W1101]|uniref:hypothetical protein n=1 Tax=Prosthecochloris sp. SCSIO W1101 TaxID=2992242 RepID=UPI00223D134D|nr:hypothetical protein [Prosthecochloris sp. SCSIO W1101]UZJ42273.1 hypothetical protein OO006_04680 [Prosthecochloris sp. SCSIO W1101]